MISQRPALTGPIRTARPQARRSTYASNICATLVTVRNGRKEVIVLGLNKPASIGRDPDRCTYVVLDPQVSGLHCVISAVRSPNGGILLSCEDRSLNGIFVNEKRFRKGLVILMDGDSLGLPDSITFKVTHLWKEPPQNLSVFDPTPPRGQRTTSKKQKGPYLITSECLGSGTFAQVFLAHDTVRSRQIACKVFRIKEKRTKERKEVEKEIQILKDLHHPNINRIYDWEANSNFIYIFLQLCVGGDLFTYITSSPETRYRLCEAEAKYIMYQLLEALKYLHNKSIAHRDLKPENILLHSPGPYPRILLADFGLARLKSFQETFTVCGTISYLPPEGVIALHSRRMGFLLMPADCWSAGVILYIMLSGCHPFDKNPSFGSSAAWRHRIAESPEPDSQDAHVSDSQASHVHNSHNFASQLQPSQDLASHVHDSHYFASHIQDSHDLASRIQDSHDLASHIQDYPNPDGSQDSPRTYRMKEKRTKERIINGMLFFDRNPWDYLPEARALAERLLIDNPRHRATVYSALDSEWIRSDLDMLKAAYKEKIIACLPPDEQPKRRV